jgi:hypothetical protein
MWTGNEIWKARCKFMVGLKVFFCANVMLAVGIPRSAWMVLGLKSIVNFMYSVELVNLLFFPV